MGSYELRAAIEAEADARVSEILRSAESEASKLRSDASARVTSRRDEELRVLEVELRRDANARIAKGRLEARKQLLDARDEFIHRVFSSAKEELTGEADTAISEDSMVARAHLALGHLPPDDPIVFTCSSSVAPALEAAVAGREGIRVECDPDLPTGFRVTGANGAIVVDATLVGLLERSRPMLAIEILRRFDVPQGEAGDGMVEQGTRGPAR